MQVRSALRFLPLLWLAPLALASGCGSDNGGGGQDMGPGSCSVFTAFCEDGDGCCPVGCASTNDDDCISSCGNNVIEPPETCDGNCPRTCDDGDPCTRDTLSGADVTCDVRCSHNDLITCTGGDGCCAEGCNSGNDTDCSATCGNGTVEPPETCDWLSGSANCPQFCSDGDECTTSQRSGTTFQCNVVCAQVPVTECGRLILGFDDGCCPVGCDANNDDDCMGNCGNGTVEAGETCDGNCPTSCSDGNACTTDTMTGSQSTCDVACANTAITMCRPSDGCCPSGCNSTNDNDCSASCGNGTVEGSETCDGNCPATCDDGMACTANVRSGSPAMCNVVCTYPMISTCGGGDGCCPTGCTSAQDSDCAARCGDGVVDSNETCDGNCPTSCSDNNACTNDTQSGTAAMCNVRCSNQPIVACAAGDGCCPPGCTSANDSNCMASCPNGTVEPPETCDGNCPTSCNDGNSCTTDTLSGTAGQCNVRCTNSAITTCTNGDGCCPMTCNSGNDNNCSASCGNGVVDTGETCDGNCPTTCMPDTNPCTNDVLTGTPGMCNVQCTHPPIASCGPAAFRIMTMSLRDPHPTLPDSVPIYGCRDITNQGISLIGLDPVNVSLQGSLDSRSMNIIVIANPLDQTPNSTNPARVLFGSCTATTGPCTTGPPGSVDQMTTYTNGTGSSTCLGPHSGTTTAAYTPAITPVAGSCFASGTVSNITVTIQLDAGPLPLPLQNVQLAALYNMNPATGLTSGLLRGFLSEANAATTVLPSGLPIVGGDPIASVFKGGAGNGCSGDDRDYLTPPSTGARGWWFYVVFTAQKVTFN